MKPEPERVRGFSRLALPPPKYASRDGDQEGGNETRGQAKQCQPPIHGHHEEQSECERRPGAYHICYWFEEALNGRLASPTSRDKISPVFLDS